MFTSRRASPPASVPRSTFMAALWRTLTDSFDSGAYNSQLISAFANIANRSLSPSGAVWTGAAVDAATGLHCNTFGPSSALNTGSSLIQPACIYIEKNARGARMPSTNEVLVMDMLAGFLLPGDMAAGTSPTDFVGFGIVPYGTVSSAENGGTFNVNFGGIYVGLIAGLGGDTFGIQYNPTPGTSTNLVRQKLTAPVSLTALSRWTVRLRNANAARGAVAQFYVNGALLVEVPASAFMGAQGSRWGVLMRAAKSAATNSLSRIIFRDVTLVYGPDEDSTFKL